MALVRDVLTRKGSEVVRVSPDQVVLDAARLMNENRIGAVVVCEGNQLVGMFTERDILCRIVAIQKDPASTRVGDVMTSPVVTCGPDQRVDQCASIMSNRKIRHLPIIEGEGTGATLFGMISTGDLMALEVAQKQAQIDAMHQYLHGRT